MERVVVAVAAAAAAVVVDRHIGRDYRWRVVAVCHFQHVDCPFDACRHGHLAIVAVQRYGTQGVAIVVAAVVMAMRPTRVVCCCYIEAVVAVAADRMVSTWAEAVCIVVEWSCCCYS